MAWTEINYSCGHTNRVQMYGPGRERERKQAWMERGVCPDCYRQEKADERAKASEVAAEQARAIGLPELVGSPKQIAWAETIRKNALMAPCNQPPSQEQFDALPTDRQDALRGVFSAGRDARNRLESEPSAKWWIDNRHTVDSYVQDCARKFA